MQPQGVTGKSPLAEKYSVFPGAILTNGSNGPGSVPCRPRRVIHRGEMRKRRILDQGRHGLV